MDRLLPGLTSAPNWHPMLVHFPIALWCTAMMFWVLWAVRRDPRLWQTGSWLTYLATLAALATLVSGFMATEKMGHSAPGHGLVHTHRNWMIAATIVSVAAAVCTWMVNRRDEHGRSRWIAAGLLLATLVVGSLGADRGALLVFRYGIGSRGETPPAAQHGGQGHDHGGHEH